MQTIAETQRLVIRKITTEDLPALLRLHSDSEVMRFSVAGPKSENDVRRFIANVHDHVLKHGFSQWAVVVKDTGDLIGECGLLHQPVGDIVEIELSYRFARVFWGFGFATEAAIACRIYAFSQLGLRRIVSLIEPANDRSIRVAQKAGLTFEKNAVLREIPVAIYSATR